MFLFLPLPPPPAQAALGWAIFNLPGLPQMLPQPGSSFRGWEREEGTATEFPTGDPGECSGNLRERGVRCPRDGAENKT